jgi:hypothetical protein
VRVWSSTDCDSITSEDDDLRSDHGFLVTETESNDIFPNKYILNEDDPTKSTGMTERSRVS